MVFQDMNCMDFVENTWFKISGDISYDSLRFLMSYRSIKETAIASFQEDKCVGLAIVLVT